MTNNQTAQPNRRKRETIVSIVVNTLLVIAIILAFVCTYTSYVTKKGSGVPSLLGYSPFSIQSDSMSPFFERGDLVITRYPEDPGAMEVGDIITFWTIINGERVLNTHRIVSVEDGGTYTYYVTKGDYNTIADNMTVHQSEVVGEYQTHIKKLGSVLDFLQTSKGFFLIVVLPVFAFFAYYLVEFFRALFAYQAEKNRQKFKAELEAQQKIQQSAPQGAMFTQEQMQEMLAKALMEATKANVAAINAAAAAEGQKADSVTSDAGAQTADTAGTAADTQPVNAATQTAENTAQSEGTK